MEPDRVLDESEERQDKAVDRGEAAGEAACLPHEPAGVLLGAVLRGRARPDTETGNGAARGRGDKDHPAKKGACACLDMGTGSGVIGILLAKEWGRERPAASTSRPTPSPWPAGTPAPSGVETGIDFVASDLFSAIKKGRTFDLICANLPYVALHEWEGLDGRREGVRAEQRPGGRESGDGALREVPGGDWRLSRRRTASPLRDRRRGARRPILGGAIWRRPGFETAMLQDLAGRQRVMRGSHGKVCHRGRRAASGHGQGRRREERGAPRACGDPAPGGLYRITQCPPARGTWIP